MAAARTGSSDAIGFAITRLVLDRPAGASRGEPTLVLVVSNDSAPIAPAGVGLTELRSGTFATCFYWLGWRLDDATASITFTWSRADAAAWGCQVSYRDADATTPFVAGAAGGGTGLTWTAPGITVDDDTLVVLWGTYNFTVDSATLPRDFTTATIGDDDVVVYGERTYATGVATGDQVVTITSTQRSADWLAVLVAVAPFVEPEPEPEPEPSTAVRVVSEPVRLSVVCDGRDLTTAASGLAFSNRDPGGFEACSFTVPAGAGPIRKGALLEVFAGLERAWRGRVGEIGPAGDRGDALTVAGEGKGAVLRERSAGVVYIDRSPGRWRAPSTQRRVSFTTYDWSGGNFSAAVDDAGRPGLLFRFPSAPLTRPIAEALYDAGVARVSRVRFTNALLGLGSRDGNVQENVFYASDQGVGASYWDLVDVRALSSVDHATTRASQFVGLQLIYAGAAGGTAGTEYGANATQISVIGDHDLQLQGTAPNADGFEAADIVRHALGQVAGIAAGVIVDSGVLATQAAYHDRVMVEQIIGDMGKLAAFHWGVWEPLNALGDDDRLDFRPYPAAAAPTCWVPYRACDAPRFPDRLQGYVSIGRVRYQDVATGSTREVSVTAIVPELETVGDREALLDMGAGSEAAADAWGRLQLAVTNRAARASGSVTLPDMIGLPGGGHKPSCLLRSGLDRLQVPDLPDRSPLASPASTSFRVSRVETTTTEAGRPVTRVELDRGPNLLEVLAARLAMATGVAQGS